MNEAVMVAAGLLLAHFAADFLLQTRRVIVHKRRYGWKSCPFLLHAVVAGLLALIFTWQWEHWLLVGVGTAATHWVIDLLKIELSSDSLRAFLTDQAAHLLVAAGIWFYLFPEMWSEAAVTGAWDSRLMIYLLGLLLISRPTGFFVERVFQQWSVELSDQKDSLPGAGRWIGYLERLLVFLFVLVQEYAGIGLLITAKSILRFRDSPDRRKITEYILVGTLLSFTCAIAIAFGVLWLESLLFGS